MKWTTTSAVAWSTAIMLLLASPASTSALEMTEKTIATLPEAKVVMAGVNDRKNDEPSQLLSMLPTGDMMKPSTSEDKSQADAKAKWEELQKDPELQKMQTEMKELRGQMRELREKRLMHIAKKLGVSTEGKTLEQIRDEVQQKMGGKKHLFHGKHVNKEDRVQHMKDWSTQNGAQMDGITAEELKAKMQEWRAQQSEQGSRQ
ncbi:hypothetical protein [Paenibacillus marinisediminis]